MFAHERSLVQKMEGRPFVLLGVNVDPTLDKLVETQKKDHLNFRSWWDGSGGSIAAQWKVEGLPTLFLIDRKGIVRWQTIGVPDLKRLDSLIEDLVREAEMADKST